MTISGHPAERGTFELFVAAFGLDELATSERFATVAGASGRTSPSCASASYERRPTFADAARAGGAARRSTASPPARCATARELAESAWAAERRAIAAVSDRRGGTIRIPNPPWRFDDVAGEITGEPRYRGEDNRAVLADLLGYDDAAIDELEAPASLSEPPTPSVSDAGGVPGEVRDAPRAPLGRGRLEQGTLEPGTLAIGTLLPGVLLPGTLLPPGQPRCPRRLQDLVDDVDRRRRR